MMVNVMINMHFLLPIKGRRASMLEHRNNSPVFAIAHLSPSLVFIYLACLYCLSLYMLDIFVLN